jgi:O-antigen/teichoic acid export membrane protein
VKNLKVFLINFIKKFKIIRSSGTVIMASKFTAGNVLVTMVSAVSGLLYGSWIGPSTLGEFNKFAILTGYLGFGIIFVDAAFQRHFQYYLGKSEKVKALEIAASAKWVYLGLFFLGTLIFSILSIIELINRDYLAFAGWLVQILAYGLSTYGLFFNLLYRSNDDFLKLNRNMLFTAGVGTITLPLIYYFNFFGLVTRKILQDFVSLLLIVRNAPFKVRAKFNKNIIIELAKLSLPLQLPVYLDSHLLTATVSLFILKNLGEQQLGIYSMALMLQGFIMVFSNSLNQIITTKLALKYGSNDNLGETFKYIIKPVLAVTCLLLAFVLIFNLSIGPIVNYLLPKYSEAVIVLQILAFDVVLAIVRSPFTLFVTSLMHKEIIAIRVMKVLLTLIALYFVHDTLWQIALIVIIANLFNVILGYVILLYKIRISVT